MVTRITVTFVVPNFDADEASKAVREVAEKYAESQHPVEVTSKEGA